MAQIQAHKDGIAASSNPAITVINYEGGSHQDSTGPSGFQTWIESYRESSTYGDTVRHYYNNMAAKGVKLHCHYMDVSANSSTPTPWRIANTYTDTTDERYLAVASFRGLVPPKTLVDSSAVAGTDFTAAPSYPAVVKTFSDATWSYRIVSGNDDGNYSISANVLSLNSVGSINFAVNATQTLKIYATDGFTDAYFNLTFSTGPATWYEAGDKFAWSTVDDTTPAALNPAVGNALTLTGTAATVVTGGWDMSSVATYTGGGATGTLAYTDSPLFVVVGRVDNNAASFKNVAVFGTGSDVVQFTTFTGPNRLAAKWNGSTGGASLDEAHSFSNTLEVHWIWFDNANLKVYSGVNLTEFTSGGTSYVSQGSATFSDFVQIGDTSDAVIAAAKSGPAVGTLTQAKAIIQKVMTKHGI
jgi:hypothetical protein